MMSTPSFLGLRVLPLLQHIAATGHAFSQHEPEARERLLNLSYALSAALETPGETIQRMCWAEVVSYDDMIIYLKLMRL